MSWCRIRRVFNIFLKGGGVRQTGNNANVDWFLVDCPAEVDFSGWRDWLGIRWGLCYRFSAFWLRSKCSICSYQLNIWYVTYMVTTILNWFLELGGMSEACLASAKGWPGIAVPPGTAQTPYGDLKSHFLLYHATTYCVVAQDTEAGSKYLERCEICM